MSSPGVATIQSVAIDDALLERAIRVDAGVVVLPASHADGKAVYTEASVMLVKELRVLGAAAEYLDPSGDRVFEVKKGDFGTLVLSFLVGIASAAAWDAMKAYLSVRPKARLSVTYVELEDVDGRRKKAWKVEGETAGVIDAIDRLRNGNGASGDSGPGASELN